MAKLSQLHGFVTYCAKASKSVDTLNQRKSSTFCDGTPSEDCDQHWGNGTEDIVLCIGVSAHALATGGTETTGTTHR